MGFLSEPISLQFFLGTKRAIGPIQVQVPISEDTNDVLTITKQPVQTGASITDHAYSEPTTLSMVIQQQPSLIAFATAGNSINSGLTLSDLYDQFLTLQSSREPFQVVTPKRTYDNMLISAIGMTTDKSTESVLQLRLSLQQVILVSVGITQVPANRQTSPKATQGIQNKGRQSAISSFAQAVKGL